MINSITIINTVTGKEIELGNGDNGKYVLDSINWDTPSVEQEAYRVPFQIGKTLEGMTVGTRKPSLVGYVIADTKGMNPVGTTWDEYLNAQQEQINDNKQELDKVISLHQDVIIQAGEYQIVGRPTQPPKYSTDETENNEVYCLFTLEFECYNPLFKKDLKVVHFAHTDDKLVFPLILTEDKKDEYVVFGEIAKRTSVLMENTGDVEVGAKIVISAVGGDVKNPSVYNVQTNERISFYDFTISNGDSIIINTETGEEDVILHHGSTGNEESIVGLLTIDSILFKVLQGEYYYSYEVDETSRNNVEMYTEFTERFYNIRGM